MDPTFLGLWSWRDPATQEMLILEVFPDGRLAQFYQQHPSIARRVSMTMRASLEAGAIFRLKTTATAEGYLIELRRDGRNLIIVNKGKTFVHDPLNEADHPPWLENARASAVWR